jgi:hypothetical protein
MGQKQLTMADVRAAQTVYETLDPRGVIYRAATVLVEMALQSRIDLTVAEALAVLLQTWNKQFYRFKHKGKLTEQHFCDIEKLLKRHKRPLLEYRRRSIEELNEHDHAEIVCLFQEFEDPLGPVGTAKALHLLAPDFFPIWDVAIAKLYKLPLGRSGTNGERYWRFMLITKRHFCDLRSGRDTENLLKAIDEYNWVEANRLRPAV